MHTNRPHGRQSSPSSAMLLKTALTNRITPLFNPQSKLTNGRPPLAPNSSATVFSNGQSNNDEMSTSILKNPAWYRDSDGRTG